MGTIAVIIVFLLLIIIHELGHFFAAKRSGVHVKEFGIGIPPKLFRRWKDKHGTNYTINAIPLGGFVRLQGDDIHNEKEFFSLNSFFSASLRRKIIILLGGIIMNILFARGVFTIIFTGNSQPLTIIPDGEIESNSYLFPSESFALKQGILTTNDISSVTIVDILSGSLANKSGIIAGDTLISINKQPVTRSNISTTLSVLTGKEFTISRIHNNETQTNQAICPPDECKLGIVGKGKYSTNSYHFSFPQAILIAGKEIIAQSTLSFEMLGGLINNLFIGDNEAVQKSINNFSGPVGAVKIGSEMFNLGGRTYFLAFAAMISLALAIFNILPIPALDGGRILTTIIQSLFKITPKKFFAIEGYINFFFFVLLMVGGILIMFQDYQNFWS